MTSMPPVLPGVESGRVHRKTMLIFRIVLWILWGILVFGPFSFACVIGLILSNPPSPAAMTQPEPHLAPLVFVDLMGSVLSLALFYGARIVTLNVLSKRNRWTPLAVAYMLLKIACWAACEGAIYFSLVLCLIARSFWPGLLLASFKYCILVADVPLLKPSTKSATASAAAATPKRQAAGWKGRWRRRMKGSTSRSTKP